MKTREVFTLLSILSVILACNFLIPSLEPGAEKPTPPPTAQISDPPTAQAAQAGDTPIAPATTPAIGSTYQACPSPSAMLAVNSPSPSSAAT